MWNDEETDVRVIGGGNRVGDVMQGGEDVGEVESEEEEEVQEKIKKFKEEQRVFKRMVERLDKRKSKAVEVVEVKASKEEDSRRREKLRDLEGYVNRAKEMGWNREKVLEKQEQLRDYRSVVKEVDYMFGIEVGEERCFVMDSEIRNVVEMIVDGENKVGSSKVRKEVGVVVESKELVPDLERKKWEEVRVVEGGRSYKEVIREIEKGKESGEVEKEKKDKKNKEWEEVKKGLELEEKLDKEVVLVMDSQEVKGGKEWSRGEVDESFGRNKGTIKRMIVKGDRIRLELEDKEKKKEVWKGRRKIG
ncbi:hypothetical protein HOY82DRAFT_615688 [Tuber indicum]|nr:hypothetical protein HOY82DRAFT_615688 [Tuber indicum]